MRPDHATGPGEHSPRTPRVSSSAPALPVSVIIPVLNESATIAPLVRRIRRSAQVLEVLVVDDGSTDETAELALRAGARVITSTLLGKGTSLEDGIREAKGDVILFLDGDLTEIAEDLVQRMCAPILAGDADLVKAQFSRDAGRVTLLTARPLLCAFFPELSEFDQPLTGIVAATRSLLLNLRLESDYGVDIGVLIDAVMKGARVSQVDVGYIDHKSQPLEVLGEMAKQVTRVILDRAWRCERLSINRVREMEEAERRASAESLPECSQSTQGQRYALFDMDGVLLEGRFVETLAERVGAATELAYFLDSRLLPDDERTRAIATLFTGVPRDVFEEVARSIPLTEGAVDTVVGLRKAGFQVGVLTDSFAVAAEIVRRRVFADFSVAHLLRFHKGHATGEVTLSRTMTCPNGCIPHPYCKSNIVRRLRKDAGLSPRYSLAVGDGENDICMLKQVGVPIAFRATSAAVESAARYSLTGPLTEILTLPGVAATESVHDTERDSKMGSGTAAAPDGAAGNAV